MSNYESRGIILIFQAIYAIFLIQAFLVFFISLYALFTVGLRGINVFTAIQFLVITLKVAILFFIINIIGTQNKRIPKKISIAAAIHCVIGIAFSLFFIDPLVNFPNILFHNILKPFHLSIIMNCLLLGIVFVFFNYSDKAKSFYYLS